MIFDRRKRFVLVLAAALSATAQQPHTGHGPRAELFVARARPENVTGRARANDSPATATGAFILSADATKFTYRITYDSLSGPPSAIHVHDFAAGRDGKVVLTICDNAAIRRCPNGTNGTITGFWPRDRVEPLSAALIREAAVMRLYLDIHTQVQKDEVRGQLTPATWMVHSDELTASIGDGEREGSGTAAFFVTPLPQSTQLTFDITIAGGTAGSIDFVDAQKDSRPLFRLDPRDGKNVQRRGGTISGRIDGLEKQPELIEALRAGRVVIRASTGTRTMTGRIVPVE
jgi:hypothetical protein